jgi:hypothetical protein
VAVVEDEDTPESKSVARIVLAERERRSGELHLTRDEFLRAPGAYLAFASDLADAVLHAARLEQEAKNLREIHELMTMIDAEEVSERITTTILDLLGLPHGTLFIHDPRHERYVVSYSNDAGYEDTTSFSPASRPTSCSRRWPRRRCSPSRGG